MRSIHDTVVKIVISSKYIHLTFEKDNSCVSNNYCQISNTRHYPNSPKAKTSTAIILIHVRTSKSLLHKMIAFLITNAHSYFHKINNKRPLIIKKKHCNVRLNVNLFFDGPCTPIILSVNIAISPRWIYLQFNNTCAHNAFICSLITCAHLILTWKWQFWFTLNKAISVIHKS